MVDESVYREASADLLPALYRIAMSILHAHFDAQDAVQQALMKAWAGRERATAQNYRAYLTRIVINECRNIQRHQKRVTPADRVDSPVPASGVDPADLLDLSRAIDALPEKLRTALLLKYMEQYTEMEIARALGIAQSAVKNRLFRARRELKKMLSAEVIFE